MLTVLNSSERIVIQGEGTAGLICHMLPSQTKQPQKSKVINTDFHNEYPLSDLET